MKTAATLFLSAILCLSIATPFLASAQLSSMLVPCGNGTGSELKTQYNPKTSGDQSTSGCNFYALVKLISNVTNLLIIASAPICVGIMVWCGVLMIMGAYSADKLSKMKDIFKNTFIAFIIILTGWLIVHIIAGAFFNQSFNIFNI